MNELIMPHYLSLYGQSYLSTLNQTGHSLRTIQGLHLGLNIKIFNQTRKLNNALLSLCTTTKTLRRLTIIESKLDLKPSLFSFNLARTDTLCLSA